MWFKSLFGFKEESLKQVRANLSINGQKLKSRKNGKEFFFGKLETPSLAELRNRVHFSGYMKGKSSIREIVADVQSMHIKESNAGSLFQVASQFNLLEMASPSLTPEHGVSIYEHDKTQGPACAIAAGAGTIYRNYFSNVNGQIGQSENNQIDCLSDLGAALGNSKNRLWEMKNGYALPSHAGLIEISKKLRSYNENKLDELRQLLRIGIQWDTQVTLNDCNHTVSQAFCSALPVAYSPHPSNLWAEFAQLILEATYESTICAAILNSMNNNNKLYLTFVGGGAFGNEKGWIINAINRSLNLFKNANLEIFIVRRGISKSHVNRLIRI